LPLQLFRNSEGIMAQVVHLSADRDGLTMRRIAIKIGDREQAQDDECANPGDGK
jgi:hypothetical protein